MNHPQQQLLKSSDYISSLLDELKKSILDCKLNQTPLQIDPVECIQKAIDLRKTFRLIADGIETNRSLIQVQKEQIQRKKVYLQGLHYYKATLKSQVANSQLQVVDMQDYLDEQPTQTTDWIEDYPDKQQKVLSTLEDFKQRKSQLQEKQLQKEKLSQQLNQQKQRSSNLLPQQAKKLYSTLQQTTKLFNLKQLDALSTPSFQSPQLQSIYNLLYPLKVKEEIDLKYVRETDEREELQVVVEKGGVFKEWYDYAKRNHILVEEKIFKFSIVSLAPTQQSQTLAVSISRREEFTIQQVFDNLFLQEKTRPIFPNPSSQTQINLNSKYSRLDWLGNVLASKTSLVSGKMLIDKIKERLFSLSLVKYALTNLLKKVPTFYFPLFTTSQQGSKLTSFPLLQGKKILFTKCEKSQFQEYKQQTYIPEWVFRALNSQRILIQQLSKSKSDKPPLSSTNVAERQLLSSFIESNHLEDLESQNVYEYYRFEVTADKNLLSGYFIIPLDYPKKKSIVKLISIKKSTQGHHHMLNVAKHHEQKNQAQQSKIFTQELKQLELELNTKITSFLQTPSSNGPVSPQQRRRKEPFFLYFQISRLISLLVEKSLQNN